MVSAEWKVILLLFATAAAYDRPNQALSIYSNPTPYNSPMFVSKNLRRNRLRQSRVLFLDEDESRQPYGRGEIDLTQTYSGKIKFDDAADYDFTSPEDTTESSLKTEAEKDLPSGNERYFDAPRLRPPFQPFPQFYQGRFGRPYAPNFGFDPYYIPGPNFAPVVRNSFYNPNHGWKARSPRVVFPFSDPGVNSLVQTNSHAGPGPLSNPGPLNNQGPVNDNVVFRDQNFGLNDVGIDDLSLQDIGTGNADSFADRDAFVPHRARNVAKRMDHESNGYSDIRAGYSKYIPLNKHFESKPMFIQTETSKILPPDLQKSYYEFSNLTRGIGGQDAVLPKFKPISDEQMLRISEILKELPIKSTNADVPVVSTKLSRSRKGRILKDSTNEDSVIEIVTEKTKKKEDRQDESCSQGGTCEFFIYCWMVGGLLDGTCGGLLKGCCHRVAKAGILGVQDSNSIDFSSNELNFGPVINDESKFF